MRLLAIDTATEACSVAVHAGGATVSRHRVVGRGHTAQLLPMIREVMAEAGLSMGQLDGLVCGIGPGSFAGVRIGLGVAKGLAFARDLPVAPVNSLECLALRPLAEGHAGPVASAIDARMNEVYVGLYRRGADGLPAEWTAPRVCPPADVPVLPDSAADAAVWCFAGTAYGTHRAVLGAAWPALAAAAPAAVRPEACPRAADAIVLALAQFEARRVGAEALEPLYLRNRVALTLVEQAQRRPAPGAAD